MGTKGCLQLRRGGEITAIAEHILRCDHSTVWNDAWDVDHTGKHGELLVKETLYIQMVAKEDSFNKDERMELYDCWVAAVRRSEQTSQCCKHNHLVTSVCLICSTTVSNHTSLCLFSLQSVSVFISHLFIDTVRSKALAFRQHQQKYPHVALMKVKTLGTLSACFFGLLMKTYHNFEAHL